MNEKLQPGGYACIIKEAQIIDYTWGQVLKICFDIEEGKFEGYFKENYEAQKTELKKWKGAIRLTIPREDDTKDWTKKAYERNIKAIEESNDGFKYSGDPEELKGKYTGVLFNNQEYEIDGKSGYYVGAHSLITTTKALEGDYKIPGTKYIKRDDEGKKREEERKKAEEHKAAIAEAYEDNDDIPF